MTVNPKGIHTEAPAAPDVATGDVADIIAELRRIIVEDLDVRIAAADVTPEVPLLEGGLALDSIVLYELITLIEKRFGFEFADDHLNTAQFENLTVLARYIQGAALHPRAIAS